ncbi:ChaN family lipoprotein [Comamonadaceae bacterium M7527]|nr:ChaN family lipoprotein [Comamonadaceae bacterium M7527]
MPHWRKHHWLFIKEAARHAAAALLLSALVGCASMAQPPTALNAAQASTLDALNTSALLLGEQHDAVQHQQLHASVISHLVSQQRLAAVVIEMADSQGQTTALDSDASEQAVQDALAWSEQAWPWQQYGPAIMQAVRAHVPVVGGNLDNTELRASMQDTALQQAVSTDVWAHHIGAVDRGHCGLIPASQLPPMARVQIARDQRMAQTIERALVPGKVVVLLTGSAHADKQVGVAQHLSSSVTSIAFVAGEPNAGLDGAFDAIWQTPALPPTDYCAELKARFKR